MDFKLSLGLFIGFVIAGASFMIGTSQCIGITILVLTAIFGFLFVNPKSPVKKYWWSAHGILAIRTLQEPGYRAKDNIEYISVWVDLVSWSGIIVSKIDVKTGRERITSLDWKSHEVIGSEHKFLDFKKPVWLGMGEHEAQLIAYTPEGLSKSRKFVIEVTV
jgi:hypothetical protein